MSKPRVAASDLCLGHHGVVAAGREVPETWIDAGGATVQTNFDQLDARGLLEPVGKDTPRASGGAGGGEPLAPPANPDGDGFDVVAATIDKVLEHVGDDPERASAAAAAERGRADGRRPRSTLLEQLDAIAGPPPA